MTYYPDQEPSKPGSAFLHAATTEGAAIGAGLAMKAVGARFGGGKLGQKMSNSKLGRLASKHIWHSATPVPGQVLTGEIGEYAGSFGAVYGSLKAKEFMDNRKEKNAYLQKAASLIQRH